MAPDQLKLKFLKEAAHLLAVTSPTTSATLGAARDKLLEAQAAKFEIPWDAIRREVCGACGNLMVPGWSCEVAQGARLGKLVKQTEKDTSKQADKEKDMIYSCLRCNRKTVQPLSHKTARYAKRDPRTKTPLSRPDELSQVDKSKMTKSASASSRQRAKLRKGGLQAMLAQSKKQDSAQRGLDLMDFMQ